MDKRVRIGVIIVIFLIISQYLFVRLIYAHKLENNLGIFFSQVYNLKAGSIDDGGRKLTISLTDYLKYKDSLVPWHLLGNEKKWLKMNPVERCAFNVLDMTSRQIKNHKKFQNNKKILTTSYENIVENTHKEISRICFFLKTKKTKYTEIMLAEEKCPKPIDRDKLKGP